MSRLRQVPRRPAPQFPRQLPGGQTRRARLRGSVRGSHQQVAARAARPPRRQYAPTRPHRCSSPALGSAPPGRPRLPGQCSLRPGSPGPGPPLPLRAGWQLSGRAAGPIPRPLAGRPVSLRQGRCGPLPPRPLGPWAAAPLSRSPSIISCDCCWPAPRSAAMLTALPLSGICRLRPLSQSGLPTPCRLSQWNPTPGLNPDAPAQRQRLMGIVVHPRGHAVLGRGRSQPHLPWTGNLRAHRRLLEARSGEEDRGGRGCTHGTVTAGERREESGRCWGLAGSWRASAWGCEVRASRVRAGRSRPQRLRLYTGRLVPDVAART